MLPYSAYGLNIASELALPELEGRVHSGDEPDVEIRFGLAAKPEGTGSYGDYLRGNSSELWFDVPDVGSYLITRGRRIWIEPNPNASQDTLRLFLLGSAFGALLLQRGYLVLHGNAIRIGDQCLVCVGESGAGKSTLAAGFMCRGFDVLADDVVPVDSQQNAIAGFPRLKLWKDAAAHLQINTGGLPRVRSEVEKYNVPIQTVLPSRVIPIRWIYILNRDTRNVVELETVRGVEAFEQLRLHSYRPEFMVEMSLQADHLRACSNLAARTRISHVFRPQDGFELDRLIDVLLHDIDQHP